MTSILCLPQEILLVIFQSINRPDLLTCHFVCQSWYILARSTLLEEVCLACAPEITQFISSVDSNPDPLYLRAVRKLTLRHFAKYWDVYIPYHLDQEKIEKLFLRFPNLQDVTADGDFTGFTKDVCQSILKHCPSLKSFKAGTSNYEVLYKLRFLLTEIRIDGYRIRETRFGSSVRYVCSFPNLTSITSRSKRLNNFTTFLPVFLWLPNVTKLYIYGAVDDQDGFAERFFSNKIQRLQDLVTDRLRQITSLTIHYRNTCCASSIQFIATYLTNLKHLSMSDIPLMMIQDSRQFDMLLQLYGTVDHCEIHMKGALMPHVNHLQAIKNVKRVLEASITDRHDRPPRSVSLKKPHPTLTTQIYGTFEELMEYYLRDLNLYDVIRIYEASTPYHVILEGISRSMNIYTTTIETVHELIKTYNGNLKHLGLDSCGIWNHELGGFLIDLGECALEKLSIDVSFSKVWSTQYDWVEREDFFVVNVVTNDEEYIFKVPVDVSSAKRINHEDLEGYVRGTDYLQVLVKAESLKYFEIFTQKNHIDCKILNLIDKNK